MSKRSLFGVATLSVVFLTALMLQIFMMVKSNTYLTLPDGKSYKILVADTDGLRVEGLSDRDSLGVYGAMYFIFPEKRINGMVMRRMNFALDMAWLDGNVITDIAENLQPEPGKSESEFTIYANKVPGNGVLEFPAGFIKEHSLKVGDSIKISNYKP